MPPEKIQNLVLLDKVWGCAKYHHPRLTSGEHSVISAHAAAPNPFAGSTRITSDLPQPGQVGAEIYDAQGRRVRVLQGARPSARSRSRPTAWGQAAGVLSGTRQR